MYVTVSSSTVLHLSKRLNELEASINIINININSEQIPSLHMTYFCRGAGYCRFPYRICSGVIVETFSAFVSLTVGAVKRLIGALFDV